MPTILTAEQAAVAFALANGTRTDRTQRFTSLSHGARRFKWYRIDAAKLGRRFTKAGLSFTTGRSYIGDMEKKDDSITIFVPADFDAKTLKTIPGKSKAAVAKAVVNKEKTTKAKAERKALLLSEEKRELLKRIEQIDSELRALGYGRTITEDRAEQGLAGAVKAGRTKPVKVGRTTYPGKRAAAAALGISVTTVSKRVADGTYSLA